MSYNKVTVTISTNLFLVLAVQYQTRRKIAKISLCKVKNFIIPKLRKVVMIYKILKLVLSKKYMSLKIRGSEKKSLTRKIVAPDLFSINNQLNIIFLVSL